MELEGSVQNGVVVPDQPGEFPEGGRVRIVLLDTPIDNSFGARYAKFHGAIQEMPDDLAEQHEHYRLGTPKK